MAAAPPWCASVRSLKRLSHLVFQSSRPRTTLLPGKCGHQVAWKSTESILGKSTILLQDGLDIRELPLLIRRMGAKEFPFFAGTSLTSVESLRNVSEQDENFKVQLHACSNVKQVFRLLEVPGEQVTAYSAAFALQRLCQVQENRSDNLDSFIQKAVFNELCDTATKEIHTLSTETVINLVRCYLKSGVYVEQFVDRIDEEVERRIGDSVFRIPDLCNLICLLSEYTAGDVDLLGNVWIHLASRYQDINEDNITEVYRTLRNMTREQKYLLNILDKQFLTCWWKLQAPDIQVIAKTLTLLNHFNHKTLKAIGKWLFMNIHELDDSKMKDVVGAYTHFEFGDRNVMTAIERYISAKPNHADKSLLGMAIEYCRIKRYLSPRIFDSVASDFENEGSKYNEIQMFYALKAFGQLNYVPPNSTKFFGVIENVLWEKFTDFQPAHIVELLTSFVYIQRFPANFIQRVFTPHFLGRVYEIKDDKVRHQVGRHLFQMQVASKLELPKHVAGFVDRNIVGGFSTNLGGVWYRFNLELGKALQELLGGRIFKRAEIPGGTPHFIDYEVCVDDSRYPMEHSDRVKVKLQSTEVHENDTFPKRIAVLTVMPEHYCINTEHLLGEYAMKRRHLRRLGYKVVEVYYEEFMWRCTSRKAKEDYVRDILQKFVRLKPTDKS